jgi:hypothetical protein
MLHSTMAVDPRGAGQVLGLACQKLFCRQETPEEETRTERKDRWRESQIWPESVREVGPPGPTSRWIHVGDRGADHFEFFEACRQLGAEFLKGNKASMP